MAPIFNPVTGRGNVNVIASASVYNYLLFFSSDHRQHIQSFTPSACDLLCTRTVLACVIGFQTSPFFGFHRNRDHFKSFGGVLVRLVQFSTSVLLLAMIDCRKKS
jgi:hypothetical protein